MTSQDRTKSTIVITYVEGGEPACVRVTKGSTPSLCFILCIKFFKFEANMLFLDIFVNYSLYFSIFFNLP